MLRPYDLLENVLIDIEKGIRKGINSGLLAEKYTLSERHLRKLFKFAFKQSLGGYIRSRKLAVSLDDLLKIDSNILDIALVYNFEYEQSYIKAFKREFGITPGNFRKSGHIVKIKPPLHLFAENKFSDGLLFGPDIVTVPQFHIVGKLHHLSLNDSATTVPEAGKNFWNNERKQIKTAVNSDVYIGMARNINVETLNFEYITSVQVKNISDIPQGFIKDTFQSSLCAKFRYIGQIHYLGVDRFITNPIYEAIWKIIHDDHSKYILLNDKIQFVKIDKRFYDGTYCQLEWFTPITEKK